VTLHPVPARWFEVLVARDDAVAALEILASTGAVELEIQADAGAPQLLPEVERHLETYRRLAQQCQAYWPQRSMRPSALTASPAQTLVRAMALLQQWCAEADPLMQSCERLKAERSDLSLLQELLQAMGGETLDFAELAAGGPSLARAVFVLPKAPQDAETAGAAVSYFVYGDQHGFLISVGLAEDLQTLEQRVKSLGGRRLVLPTWLASSRRESLQRVLHRVAAIAAEVAVEDHGLQALEHQYQLGEVLGDILLLDWFVKHMRACPGSENFCWLTGWTSDLRGRTIARVLRRSRVRAVLRFADPPEGAVAPMVMRNPWWVRPFEIFPRLLGVPDAHEVDPTVVLAAVVPLLFGYMFGDLGHGLVLVVAGLSAQHRWPQAGILIPCGLSGMLFGWVFGSVFGLENVVAPLWAHPLARPMLVLGVPLLGGAFLMVLGLLLGGIEAHWRGRLAEWSLVDAAVVVIYLGGLISILHPRAVGLALAGLVWYLGGSVRLQPASPLHVLLVASGRLLESVFQLAVNTLSFARVGAFALAHAGLSLAMVGLAQAVGAPAGKGLVLVIGNILIIVLEALVVSVQTARLILFEFFIRFLRAEGRVFKPIPGPPSVTQGDSHEVAS
jgi:V/A-type H+-transporting ATPase subunit I